MYSFSNGILGNSEITYFFKELYLDEGLAGKKMNSMSSPICQRCQMAF